MKIIILSLLLVSTVQLVANAQWQKRIGINTIPLTIRTVELTSEFSRHPAYALTFNAGYAYKSGFDGLVKLKVDDGVRDRKSSGLFIKVGGRIYLLSLNRKEPSFNIFVGAQLIGSQYHQTATQRIIGPGFDPTTAPVIAAQANGFIWGTALSGGATFRLSNRFTLDAGLQYGFQPTRTDYIGLRNFNYQPGFGISRTGKQVTSLQGILTLKYQL